MTLGAIKNYLDISQPRRSEAEAAARVPVEECAEAKRQHHAARMRMLFNGMKASRLTFEDFSAAFHDEWLPRARPWDAALLTSPPPPPRPRERSR